MKLFKHLAMGSVFVLLSVTAWGQQATTTAPTSTLAAQAVCADRGQDLFKREKPLVHDPGAGPDEILDSFVTHYDAKADRCYWERTTSTALGVTIEMKDAFAGTTLARYSCFIEMGPPLKSCLPNPLHEFLPDADVYCHIEGSAARGWKDSDCKSGYTFESRVEAIYGLKR